MPFNIAGNTGFHWADIDSWLREKLAVLMFLFCIHANSYLVGSPSVYGQVFLDESSRVPLLLEGTSRCTESNLIGSKSGSILKFAVACNRDSAIFVWDAPVREVTDRNECLSFALVTNDSLVNLLCRSDSPASLIRKPKRSDLLLLEGKKTEVSPFACPGVFSRFGLGVFFGSDDLGFDIEAVQGCLTRGEKSLTLPTGVLSLGVNEGRLESIEFDQNEDSIFSNLDKSQTRLGTVSLPGSESGEKLASRHFVVRFDKPVLLPAKAPWDAHASVEYRGGAGGVVSAEYDISISAVQRDGDLVRTAIENVKQLIPNGASIAPIDAVAKQWNDGRVVPVIDENAVEAANSVLWGTSSFSYLPTLVALLAFVIIGGAWLFRRSMR